MSTDSTIREQADGSYLLLHPQGFDFDDGGRVAPLEVVFETWGQLNEARDNAIIVHHALSTSAHLAASEKNPQPGWWDAMLGPGKSLDTDRYFIICCNNLGSCFGSSGPTSIDPATGESYGPDFPEVSFADMARSQQLVLKALGIEQLYAVVGNSMGAMLSLTWATLYPRQAQRLVSISSSAVAFPANRINRELQSEIIRQDAAFSGGRYKHSSELRGFLTARKFGLLTYRSWNELNERFFDKRDDESIEHYLDYNGRKFLAYFDCNSYLRMLGTMDSYDPRQGGDSFTDALAPIRAKVLVISVASDTLYPPPQQEHLHQQLCDAGVDSQFINHDSTFGHDAFLVETDDFNRYLSGFLNS